MTKRRMIERNCARAAALVGTVAYAALAMPTQATAYVGPGAGLTAIGIVVALLAAVVLALIGFVWYPLRRLMGRRNKADSETTAAGETK